GKLTTGVTIRPWTGIFMLRNLKSPETYFQSAFRVQSPWTVKVDSKTTEILKKECYIFDFAINRALMQIKDYAKSLNINGESLEQNVAEFTSFLPVLAYDGSAMKQINAAEILDITMSGTSATLLARRWQSALLVNVTDDVLQRLLNNKEALDALMRIEGFRTLNKDLETIIIKSQHVKDAKKDGTPKTDREKQALTAEEKEYKTKRKEIQEKLIKFATRVPIFMYLTDYREQSLKDVITQLEPGLFKKVTGLDVKDFNLLCTLGVFNSAVMNEAIWNFKRYEDSSLSYTGIDRHEGEGLGLWDTSLSYYDAMAKMLSESEIAKKRDTSDRPKAFDVEYAGDGEDETGASASIIKRTAPPEHVTPTAATTVVNTSHSNAAPKKTVQETKIIEIDFDKIKVGAVVTHKAFGQGVIEAFDTEHYIKVRFGDSVKTFKIPDAFLQGFLKI
ncbi:MAG: restriction endonuclease, partial [Firmicutes bacterium]|nr:restriction endonuclease [Bacillota bacterium]